MAFQRKKEGSGFQRKKEDSGFQRKQQPATPEGEVGALTPADDIIRVIADSMTRGYADKVMGPEEQAHTERSRERLPGWAEAPADIGGAVLTSPYRIGGALAGGLWGAGEGAVSAYGHQNDWVPDVGNMAWEAGKGALLGSGAAKAGEWIGKGWNAMRGKAPYSTSDELADAASQADRRTRIGKDTAARNERMKAAELAQGEGPEGFRKLRESMDQFPHREQVAITKLANPKSKNPNWLQKSLQVAGSMAEGGGGVGKFWTGPLNIASPLLKALGSTKSTSAMDWQNLQQLILDSTGKLKRDKATVDLLRDFLAKSAIARKEEEGERTASDLWNRVRGR